MHYSIILVQDGEVVVIITLTLPVKNTTCHITAGPDGRSSKTQASTPACLNSPEHGNPVSQWFFKLKHDPERDSHVVIPPSHRSLLVSLSMSSCSGASSRLSTRPNSCTKKMKCLKEVLRWASSSNWITCGKCWW